MPAEMPERAADLTDAGRQAATRDIIQNAAVGTSLIGQRDMNRIVGLAAVSRAASAPVVRPDTYDPSTAVKRTSRALERGVTTNGPQLPPTLWNTAIRSGNPGA